MGMMFRKLKYAGIRPPQGKKTRWYQDTVTVFAIGVLIGVGLAVTVHHFQDASKYQTSLWQYYLSPVGSNSNGRNLIKSYLDGVYDFKYENWLSKVYGAFGQPQDPDKYRYSDVGGIEAKPRYVALNEIIFFSIYTYVLASAWYQILLGFIIHDCIFSGIPIPLVLL